MCDRSGDGAGVCTQIPHSFFLGEMEELVDQFPGKFEYGVGNVFFPKEKEFHVVVEEMMRGVAEEMGFELVGVRYLPLNKVIFFLIFLFYFFSLFFFLKSISI